MDGTDSAVKELFEERKKFIVIGLTGRTGSGCSTTAGLMEKKWADLKPPKPQSGSFSSNEERKYRILFDYAKENWKKFQRIRIKDVITSFILQEPFDEFAEFVIELSKDNPDRGQMSDNDLIKELRKIEEEYKRHHELVQKLPKLNEENDYSYLGCDLRLMSVNTADDLVNEGRNLVIVALVSTKLHIRIFDANGKRVVDKAENELISGKTLTTLKNQLISGKTLTTLKNQLNPLPDESSLSPEQKQKIIRDATSIARYLDNNDIEELLKFYFEESELPTFSNNLKDLLRNISKDNYTKIYQVIGDNIRSSGNAFRKDFSPSNIFSIARSTNKLIKLLRKKHDEVFIVIDTIRNPFEATFFRDRYSAFYLIAVNCPNEDRIKRLQRSCDYRSSELKNIDNKEYEDKLKSYK
jgi:dephospho-CoA kinase